MTVTLHKNDLPADIDLGNVVAIDTEAMGLNNHRDRLCVVQLSSGDGTAHLVQMERGHYHAPNLKRLLNDPDITKIFHFARFDIGILRQYLGANCTPLYCTKIASYLCRTYSDKHGLRDLCKELLGVEISKQQQSSDWGAKELSKEQMNYAAADVLYLHRLREKLNEMLIREERMELAAACFEFLPVRAKLDLEGWPDTDIFSH